MDDAWLGVKVLTPRRPETTPPRQRVDAADTASARWRFTTERPSGNWQSPEYDDSSWQQGAAGFGTTQTPGERVGTVWNASDIWLRRKFDVTQSAGDQLYLHIHHDEDSEVYINGVLAKRTRGFTTDYEQIPIRATALAAIKPKGNVLAVHCRQTTGGQYIDVGIVTLKPEEN